MRALTTALLASALLVALAATASKAGCQSCDFIESNPLTLEGQVPIPALRRDILAECGSCNVIDPNGQRLEGEIALPPIPRTTSKPSMRPELQSSLASRNSIIDWRRLS